MKLAILFLVCCLSLAAQDLQVNDSVVFQGNDGQALDFSASFSFNPQTGAIIPGSLNYTSLDPYGFGPFTASPFDTTFSSTSDLNFIGNGAWVQISLWDTYGTPAFPGVGNYGFTDTVLLCGASSGCAQGYDSEGYLPASSGSLTITDPPFVAADPAETPEPSTWVLLLSGVLLWGVVEFLRKQ